MNTPILYVGNKNYSSWSLRPWLCLRWAGIVFEDRLISLKQEGYGIQRIAEVLAVSPSGKVPALRAGDTTIWDSLAIAEWAAENSPEGALWPTDPDARAVARAAACEMHSGFPALRDDLPMNINRRCKVASWPEATQRDIDRVIALWTSLRERFAGNGPWLAGTRSIADAMYAPVVTRFRTYGVELPDRLTQYCETLLDDADFREWESSPVTDRFPFIDDRY